MTRAALVIQSRYRTYCEHKRFKKSQEAAVCIQNYYRQYKEQERQRHGREGTPGSLKSVARQPRSLLSLGLRVCAIIDQSLLVGGSLCQLSGKISLSVPPELSQTAKDHELQFSSSAAVV